MTIKTLKIVPILLALVALITITTSVYAANSNDNTRPGWGFGDINHIHTGPPGQSVNPGNNVSQSNFTVVSNNVSSVSNLGGNKAKGGSVTTGDSNSIVSIVTNVGSNILHFFGI